MSLIFFISCSENEENFVEVNDLNVSSDKVFPEKVIDLSIENILIYPNPAQNEITIDASNASIDYERILITDITGKIIFETAVGGNKITAINLGSFANGIYNARIVSKSGITVKQFIKK